MGEQYGGVVAVSGYGSPPQPHQEASGVWSAARGRLFAAQEAHRQASEQLERASKEEAVAWEALASVAGRGVPQCTLSPNRGDAGGGHSEWSARTA